MGMFDSYNVAVSGMEAQRFRVDIINTNIANAHTVMTENGEGPYKRRDVVFREKLIISKENNDFEDEKFNHSQYRGVEVAEVIVNQNYKLIYEPSNPYADEKGYVKYPDINVVAETTDLIDAQRSYDANVNAYKNKKNIDLQTINLLKD